MIRYIKHVFSLIFIFIFIFGNYAYSAGRNKISYEYPWVVRSVAALGMGDANYTKSNDKYALFYNPAGLSYVDDAKIDIIPISAGVNNNIVNFYDDYKDINTDNESQVSDLITKHLGKSLHADVLAYPSYTKRYFSVGFFAAAQANALPANPVLPELNVDAVGDYGFVIGASRSFIAKRLHVGVAGRIQNRRSLVRSYTFNDIAAGDLSHVKASDFEESTGYFVDIGVIYEFSKNYMKPRIGGAINNIGTNSMGKAKDIPYAFNASFGISPYLGYMSSDIILDIRDITQNNGEDNNWGKRINLGAEIRFFDIIALRTGLHQGYISYGAGLDFYILKLNYACYYEERGAYSGQQHDKRQALEVIIGF